MTSRFVTRLAFAFMFLACSAGMKPALAQTSLGWGQHVSRYGSGYVGNVPNTVPVTTFYRAPAVAAVGQPVTTMYAPAATYPTAVGYAPVAASGYSPAVSYRVGTPNAAAYTTAYSPVVAPTTPYNANWQYPPQTVFPTTAQPVVANYAPAPYYTTNYARTPVTTYRPVTVLSPVGTPQTVLQPCTGYECQARRQHCCGFCSWLFGHHRPAPVTPVVPAVPAVVAPTTVVQPTVTNYPCPAPCGSGVCPQPAAVSQPYYTPGPTTTTPLTAPATSVPANTIPSLTAPPSYPLGSSPTTISPPSSVPSTITTPGTTVSPGVPASQIPALPPSQFNSGPQRLDYPPAVGIPYAPATPSAPAGPITPIPAETNGNGAANEVPSLIGPANAPTKTLPEPSVPPPSDDGARLYGRPQYDAQPQQQPPRAVIRRDSNITPIPDPEYGNRSNAPIGSGLLNSTPSNSGTGTSTGARTKAKAPQLISPRDRTAQATQPDAKLASFEREMPVARPVVAPAPAATPRTKVLGDDIWRSAK
jgi:DNA-directed RNA polymerase II subunit RPB1